MASQGAEVPASSAIDSANDTSPTSRPVEMSTIEQTPLEQAPHPVDQVDPSNSMAQPPSEPSSSAPGSSSQPQSDSQHAPLTRKMTEALGPATDEDITAPALPGTALNINLMLTTGAKHPYKIDEKYLNNRNTVAKDSSGKFDPLLLSGYKLKELVWTDWRKEWEARPASPTYIRLIRMGKMIDDKKTLNDYSFKTDKVNVVHMTVKPSDFGDDEETAGKHAGKGGSIRTRDGGEGGAGCRCVIL